MRPAEWMPWELPDNAGLGTRYRRPPDLLYMYDGVPPVRMAESISLKPRASGISK